jgi:hypothetical protein
VFVGVALGLLLARTTPHEWARVRVAAIVGVATFTVPILLSLVPSLDYLFARNLAAAWVPLAVVAGAGFSAVGDGGLGRAALAGYSILAVAINVVTADVSKFESNDWRAAAAAVGSPSVARAIVLTPPVVLPLQIYRPMARVFDTSEAYVDEVVIIGLPSPFRRLGYPKVPPRSPSPRPPPQGFILAESIEAPTFTLVRYRANERHRVTPDTLGALALSQGKVGLLRE